MKGVIRLIRHILFDLDGTLAPINMDFFLQDYMGAISARFKDRFPEEEFMRKLFESTTVMVKNTDPDHTNEEVFWEDFPRRVGVSRETLEPVFRDFYSREYRDLKSCLPGPGPAREVITEVFNQGFTVTVATNPLFPIEALCERLAWIGCDGFPFQFITSMEKMHFCKPHIEYYQEVLAMLGALPEECLMVGNDMEEDMVAKLLGMKTCLVTDRMIHRGKLQVEPDYRCTLAEVGEVVRRLK